ncbi:hypothetical protein BGZ76_009716 [Entomortierella beljakovae]|nr:hypothetical protein BGZ76_009716 [Entomortierella beljakovae]
MPSIKSILFAAMAMAMIATVQAQEVTRDVTDRGVSAFPAVAEGVLGISKRAGCTDPVYSLECGELCCKTLSCSKSGSGCGCPIDNPIECTDGSGGCCPILYSCAPNNKCSKTIFGGDSETTRRSSAAGAMAVVVAMAGVFANA